MLAKMFDPESKMKPGLLRNGAYFLDRDPEWFRIILNYLRYFVKNIFMILFIVSKAEIVLNVGTGHRYFCAC